MGNYIQKGESFSPKIYSVHPWVANGYEMEYTEPKPSLFIFFSTISIMYKQTYLENKIKIQIFKLEKKKHLICNILFTTTISKSIYIKL